MTGAADDCFTCAKRGAQCDRRRPYCSQCIELGHECSGYKTTLTWGVGVASRGKLRGLSLPVKGSRPAVNPPKIQRKADSTQLPQLTRTFLSTTGAEHSQLPLLPGPVVSMPQHQPPGLDASVNMAPMPTMHVPPAYSNISAPFSHEADGVAICTHSWLGLPQTSTAAMQWQELEEAPTEQGNNNEPQIDSHLHNTLRAAGHSPSFSQLLLARSVGRTPRLRYLISYYVEVIAPVIVAFDGPTNPLRTQVLLLAEESESLQEAIATLSTNNLKRRQEAKTMATERTLSSRMSSMAHRALTESSLEDAVSLSEGLVREEQYHRRMAVQALNSELGDPHRRLSDSVVATLLVLCLFHACDTGVAQFKTQFTGVKKLLAIRMRNAGALSDSLKWFIRFFTWFDTLTATTNNREAELSGTCLDITTSSNEEWGLENTVGCDSSLFKLVAQLSRLNLLSRNQPVRAPTSPETYPATTTLPPPMLHTPLNSSCGDGLPASGPVNIYGFPMPMPGTYDPAMQAFSPAFWSEWFSLRQRLESWRIPQSDETAFQHSHAAGSPLTPPVYMSPPLSPGSQNLVVSQNLPDIFNISESFRHAAILYCERLAYPDLPSSHPRIQNIVQMALRHISEVQSDVYLLWPLFITGSECVLEEHRVMIRRRCTDISKDSGFFNNLSCLELLEKIWTQNLGTGAINRTPDSNGMYHDQVPENAVAAFASNEDPLDNIQPSVREHGFRWDPVMQSKRADGEYMMV